jgi:S1-C subfamily serine protease
MHVNGIMLLCIPALLFACGAPSLQAQPVQTLDRVFESVHRAVVTLHTKGRAMVPGSAAGLTTVGGIGSGVLISADGDILTAAHVVQSADKVLVEFPTGEVLPALVVSSVPQADEALLATARWKQRGAAGDSTARGNPS